MIRIILLFVFTLLYVIPANCQDVIELKYENGVYTLPCAVNGLNLNFIFDTGAAVTSISSAEALFMLKNGYLSERDFIDSEQYITADGSIIENAVFNIKELKIGQIIINDVRATVINSVDAPLLLGQSAISKLQKWHIDSNYLYIENSVIEKFNAEEYYNRAIELETEGKVNEAYRLLLQLSMQQEYSKAYINFVIRNKYEDGIANASKLCLEACLMGDPEMISLMRNYYFYLAPKDKKDKFEFYKLLYDNVSKFYAISLSDAFYNLNKPNVEATEYTKYLKLAIEQALQYSDELAAEYYTKLGYLYSDVYSDPNIINATPDRETSLMYFKQGATLGTAHEMDYYGEALLKYEDIDQSTKEEAVYWLERAAALDYGPSILFLFNAYYQGNIIEKNYPKSIDYGKQLLNINDPIKETYRFYTNARIGFMYYELKHYEKAMEYLLRANRYSDDTLTLVPWEHGVFALLGDCYYFGDGTSVDYVKALEMYTKEYEYKDSPYWSYCAWKLGSMYDRGIGTEEDKNMAFNLYKEGANHGDALCQAELAYCYYFGPRSGFPIEDYEKSLFWANKAIENDETHAYLILGYIYSDNNSSYYNIAKAITSFKKASESGEGYASYLLGEIYETGEGNTPKNYKLAETYYRLALEQGETRAEEKLLQFQ